MDGDSMGGAGGIGSAGGAAEAGGLGSAAETNSVGAADRAEVADAAAHAKPDAVDAQADAIAGPAKDEDGFDRAATTAATNTTTDEFTATDENAAPKNTTTDENTVTKHATPSEGTITERARREAATIAAVADRLAASSPTAARILGDFRAAGGQFELSPRGAYFRDRATPTIGIPQGPEATRMQQLSHELGHVDFRNNPAGAYVPPGRPTGMTDHQIEQRREYEYIVNNAARNLLNEGHATVINNQIRNELRAALGIDIGVAGDSTQRPMPLNPTAPIEVQRQEIADFYARNLTTGLTGQNYRAYYNQPYIDFYRDNFLPGGPGNMR